ncbi:MAG: hypothetical protein WBO09_01675 [Methylocystis silviterrae]|uniref:hypothetical protein n=1 Tax=Methylocystis silviterrae TaxID=2743612 RepID=UPI003C78598D
MADYLNPTVIQQTIPQTDISPLELLLLQNIFTVERCGDDLYFFAEGGPSTLLTIDRGKLEAAIAASKSMPNSFAEEIGAQQLSEAPPDEVDIEIDMSATSWEPVFQDIVRRSATLTYITAVSSFTCTKMRSNGFGGMAIVITRDTVFGKSTNDIIEDFLADAGIDQD